MALTKLALRPAATADKAKIKLDGYFVQTHRIGECLPNLRAIKDHLAAGKPMVFWQHQVSTVGHLILSADKALAKFERDPDAFKHWIKRGQYFAALPA